MVTSEVLLRLHLQASPRLDGSRGRWLETRGEPPWLLVVGGSVESPSLRTQKEGLFLGPGGAREGSGVCVCVCVCVCVRSRPLGPLAQPPG